MSQITTHVLDLARGAPAEGMAVTLEGERGEPLATATTDANGRVAELGPAALAPGVYRLRFDTARHAATAGGFYPEVTIAFRVADSAQHYHVPLLLGPWGYTTYRGS
jgi:5-hydroxyisourate hydrolase